MDYYCAICGEFGLDCDCVYLEVLEDAILEQVVKEIGGVI